MLETEFQSASRKIDNERPIKVTIAIASHHGYARPNPAELVENGLRANITQVPDFVSIFGDFSNRFWQTIVGVGQNENMQGVLRFLRRWHSAQSYLCKLYTPRAPAACLDACVDLRDSGCYVASPALP
jgi:hypothetical protein